MISFKPLERTLRERDLNVTKLAELVGTSQGNLYKMLYMGVSSTNLIEKICLTLNCQIQDVIEWTEEEVSLQRVNINWDIFEDVCKANGYSYRSLSLKLNRSVNYILNKKKQNSTFQQTELDDICKILNCNKEDLLVY